MPAVQGSIGFGKRKNPPHEPVRPQVGHGARSKPSQHGQDAQVGDVQEDAARRVQAVEVHHQIADPEGEQVEAQRRPCGPALPLPVPVLEAEGGVGPEDGHLDRHQSGNDGGDEEEAEAQERLVLEHGAKDEMQFDVGHAEGQEASEEEGKDGVADDPPGPEIGHDPGDLVRLRRVLARPRPAGVDGAQERDGERDEEPQSEQDGQGPCWDPARRPRVPDGEVEEDEDEEAGQRRHPRGRGGHP
mmetsp:Transcript_4827/g.13512  ORF Transcript_4827/g.13512 Transcript_4827/m.13512 type:complete len:244 (-) Transcript_4827:1384-2115(-)